MPPRARRVELPGDDLREARVRAGLSQDDVASRLGVSQPTISTWEVGKTAPSPEQLVHLKAFLPLAGPDEVDAAPAASPVGEWLARTRQTKGLTRRELAERSGVSEPQIWNIETGHTANPRETTRKRLSKALGEALPKDVTEQTEDDAEIQDVGTLTDFDPHDDQDLPGEPGIYVFYDISERPIYVGESKNIRDRILGPSGHKDKFWFRRPIVETGAYVQIRDQKLRQQVERTMIRFLRSNAVINRQNVTRSD